MGADALNQNRIGFDIYPVDLKRYEAESELNFLLREIEYETSTIKELSYATIEVPVGEELGTDDSHHNIYVVSKDRVVKNVSSMHKNVIPNQVFTTNVGAISPQLEQPIQQSLCLDAGEEISFVVEKSTIGQTHLAVASFFHQLHTGGVDKYLDNLHTKSTQTVISSIYKTVFTKSLPVFGTLGVLLASFVPFNVSLNDESLLKVSNSIPTVQADTPHKSLYYYYKNAMGSWAQFSTVHPRFKLSQRSIIKIPDEAFVGNNTEAEIKIVSNTKHFIYSVGIVDQVKPVEITEFTPVTGIKNKKTHHNFADNAQFVTLPGDELSFTVAKSKFTDTHVFFKIRGHYSPLACESKEDAEKWWSKLTTQEQALMIT
jgi:hypothetical protein